MVCGSFCSVCGQDCSFVKFAIAVWHFVVFETCSFTVCDVGSYFAQFAVSSCTVSYSLWCRDVQFLLWAVSRFTIRLVCGAEMCKFVQFGVVPLICGVQICSFSLRSKVSACAVSQGLWNKA